MRRGEIWREIGKTRPVVVLQADALTRADLPTVLAAPLSTQFRQGAEPLRIAVPARGRLLADSWVCVEQLRALDVTRFGEGPLAELTPQELQALEQTLVDILGIGAMD
jgi:mRNA interferase MazF